MIQVDLHGSLWMLVALSFAGCLSAAPTTDSAEETGAFQETTHSFSTAGGQRFDCVDRDRQPALIDGNGSFRRLRQPPSKSRMVGTLSTLSTQFDGTLDGDGNIRNCPIGTVPLLRVTGEMKAAAQRFLGMHKALPMMALPVVQGHDHAVFGTSNLIYSAPQWIMSLQVPSVPVSSDFSLN